MEHTNRRKFFGTMVAAAAAPLLRSKTGWRLLAIDSRIQPIARWMTVTLDGKTLDYCLWASELSGSVEVYKQPFEIDWDTGRERLIWKYGHVVLGLSPAAPDDVVRDYYKLRES